MIEAMLNFEKFLLLGDLECSQPVYIGCLNEHARAFVLIGL